MGTVVVLIVTLVVIGATVLWNYGGTYLAEKTSQLLNAHVLSENTRISVIDFGGFPLHNVDIEQLQIDRAGPDLWFPFVFADRIHVLYDLWGALNGRYVVSRLEVEGLKLEFRTFGQGPILLPQAGGSEGDDDSDGGEGPSFWIKTVALKDASALIELPIREVVVDSLNGELSIRSGRGGLRFEIKHLVGKLRDSGETLELMSGAVLTAGELRFEDIVGIWGGSPFTVTGTPGHVDLELSVEDFPLDRLGRFLGLDVMSPGYVERVQGRLFEDANGLAFDWDGAASWEPWVGRRVSGRGRIADRQLVLRDVNLQTDDAGFSEATIQIPFDRPTVEVEGNFENLHTRALRVEAFEDWPGILNGKGNVTIVDRGDPFHRVEARLELGRGHLLEVPFVDGLVSGEINENVWSFDTVLVNLEEAGLRGRGTLGLDTIDLSFGYRGDLRPWRKFLGRDELEGEGQLRVRLFGSKEQPVLQASGALLQVEIANVTAPQVELREALGVVTNGRRLAIGFRAPRGVTIAGTPFSRAEGDLVVTEDQVIMDDLQLDSGDTTLTMVGVLRWEPTIRVQVDHADASVDGRRFWVDEPGELIFNERVLSTSGIRIRTPRGQVEVQGSWNTESNFVDGSFELENLDPSVFFPPEEPPGVAIGKISGKVDIKGAAPHLNGRVDLGLREVDWSGGHLDSASVAFSVTESTLSIDRLEPIVHGGSILLFGEIVLPGPVYQEAVSIVQGEPPPPDEVQLDLNAHAFNVNLPFWRFLLPQRERVAGIVGGDLQVSGTAADPRLNLEGEVRNLVWQRSRVDAARRQSVILAFEADTIRVEGQLANRTVTLDRLLLTQEGKSSKLTGSFPLALVLYPFEWELPAREMNLLVNAEDGSLKNLELTPWIDEASGSLQAHVRVGGTPQAPRFYGEARVTEGTLEIENRDEVVADVAASIQFEGDLILVEDAVGLVGVKWYDPHEVGGIATARGTYRLGASEEETYELLVRANKSVVGQEGEYAAEVSGDLIVKPERAWDGKIYPFARGELFVHELWYKGTLEPQDIGEFKQKSILYSVELKAPAKIYVQTEKVDAELGGELIVHQDVDKQTIFGQLEIYRCQYQFFQKTFKTTRGELIWSRADTRLPEMDVTAETRVGSCVIRADLTGLVGEAVVDFSAQCEGAEADLTQQQILELLFVGSAGLPSTALGVGGTETGEGGPETSEQVLVGTSQLFLGPLEREVARQMMGIVDEVDIETEGELGGFVPTFGVRKWVTPELSFQFKQGLSSTYQQELGVEYRLQRALYLRGAMTNRLLSSRGAAQEYNLDLKFRLDY
jgi:hypothetical protein